jgi:DNA polymerase III alpha subunit (gram-positive type)
MASSTNYRIHQNYLFRVFQTIFSFITLKLTQIRNLIFQYSSNIVLDEVIFFDFETTGLNPYHSKIIEYCFIVNNDENSGISDIVDPEEKIDKIITDITGIHPDMFEGKLPINEHIHIIYNFINGTYKNSVFSNERKYLVAHNCHGFDKIFLERALFDYKQNNANATTSNFIYVDSLLLARKLLPQLRSHSMASLAKHYKISEGGHRAKTDVLCLKKVYQNLLVDLSNELKLPVQYFNQYPQVVVDYTAF